LERIEEYDSIGAILNDMAYNPHEKGSRYFEGSGSINTLQAHCNANPVEKRTFGATYGSALNAFFFPNEPD
jgi:hypothetical protein